MRAEPHRIRITAAETIVTRGSLKPAKRPARIADELAAYLPSRIARRRLSRYALR